MRHWIVCRQRSKSGDKVPRRTTATTTVVLVLLFAAIDSSGGQRTEAVYIMFRTCGRLWQFEKKGQRRASAENGWTPENEHRYDNRPEYLDSAEIKYYQIEKPRSQ